MASVDADIAKARTLPPAAFVDQAWLDRELATLFRSAWLLVPERPANELRDDPRSLADLVARRGARAPFPMLDAPFFLQRDWEGGLRAFPNVCTHAWHTLVQGPDRQRTITCAQHGRQFDAEGKCLAQPGFDGAQGFPSIEDHLQPLPVSEWGPLLFACLGKPAVDFEKAFAPIAESLAKMPLDKMTRRPMAGEVRELSGNWKQHAWNYMDRFHIPFIHRKPGGLADALELSSYKTELHGEAALQWAYAKDPAHGFDPAMLPERFRDPSGKRVYALWWFLFPNLALNFYPWGLSINVYMPVPTDPRRALFLWYHHVMDEPKYAMRESVWMNTDVDLEDVDAMTQVGRGVASGFAKPGRFAAREEEGPHWLHRLVAERVGGH
jgi:choline monooxygenase